MPVTGMPVWWVSEPYINMRLEDEPLGYQPARGSAVKFHLSYRQRGAIAESAAIFGVGANWSCSFRAYLVNMTPYTPGLLVGHQWGAGWIDYTIGVPQFRSDCLAEPSGLFYQLQAPDGSVDVYGKTYTDPSGVGYFFLTLHTDPDGNTTTYQYSSSSSQIQLLSVTDPQGLITELYYDNASFPNQITRVVDPYNRTSTLQYNASGYLTNITDVAGLSTSFAYDSGTQASWITNMITPYGTNSFRYGGVDADSTGFYDEGIDRFVEITQPDSGKQLYLYRQDCSSFLPATYSPFPSTSPLANSLDNVDQYSRNSFHWGPLQYENLSEAYLSSGDPNNLTTTDYSVGQLRHWLLDPSTGVTSDILSLQRAPTPDGVTTGQMTWFDYGGKASGNNYIGTNAFPSLEALVLPDGSTRFTHYNINFFGRVSQDISSYSAQSGSAVLLRTNTYVYAANNIDLASITNALGVQTSSNMFNLYHQVVTNFDALKQTTVYTYDTSHRLTSMAAPSGLLTTNTYGSDGFLAQRVVVGFSTNIYTYSSGLVYNHIDERGLSTTNTWDNLQRLRRVNFPDHTFITNNYINLDLVKVLDRMGFSTSFGYDSMRRRITETNALGRYTLYNYCACGALNSIQDAAGYFTTFYYDNAGQQTNAIYADDYSVTNFFNLVGQMTSRIDSADVRLTNSFNNQGLITSVSNELGRVQGMVYDPLDRATNQVDANGVNINSTYDVLNRIRTRSYPDGGVESFGYTLNVSGVTSYTNQLEEVTWYAYDTAMRKMFETNANTEVLRFTFSGPGDLLTLTDGKNQTTKWNYDQYGRVTNKVDQAGTQILVYQYDSDNRLTNRWSAAKGNTAFSYDSVGNLTYFHYPVSYPVTLAYDAMNRLTNMMDVTGTSRFTYTPSGQLLTEDGPFASDTVTNTYWNRFRVEMDLQQPTGLWTNAFVYDMARRLYSVASPAGEFIYDYPQTSPSTLLSSLVLPNTSYITNRYDENARLLSTLLKTSSGTILDSGLYGYNAGNQRTTFTNAAGTYVDYSYDLIGQLKVADSSVNSEDRGYQYDTAWNLNVLTNNGATLAYAVDGKNQLVSEGGNVCTYDSNGNLTALTSGAPHGTSYTYGYDDENRLLSVMIVASTGTTNETTFVYDGMGRLRAQYQWLPPNGSSGGGGGSSSVQAGVATASSSGNWNLTGGILYVYDGYRVIQERDTNNAPAVSYTRGTDLSGTLEGAGGIGGLLARSDGYSAGNFTDHNYYHADGNGNITYLENSAQGLAASYRYDPFGNTTASSGPLATTNTYRFSSKEYMATCGFYYYLYRFYSPSLQRWLNRDALGENSSGLRVAWETIEGPNLYVMVHNDPMNRWDINGLMQGIYPPRHPIPPGWPRGWPGLNGGPGTYNGHRAIFGPSLGSRMGPIPSDGIKAVCALVC